MVSFAPKAYASAFQSGTLTDYRGCSTLVSPDAYCLREMPLPLARLVWIEVRPGYCTDSKVRASYHVFAAARLSYRNQ